MKLPHILLFVLFSGIIFNVSAAKQANTRPAEELTPADIQFDYYFADALKEKLAGHFDAAMDLLNACNRLKPDDGNVMFEMAKIHSQFKQTDQAIACLEKASATQPGNVWFKKALAEQYLDNQKIDLAINTYKSIVKADPDNDDALMMLISIYSQTGKYNDAIDALNMLEKSQGMNEDVTMEKARLYFMQNQNKKGIAEVEKLVSAYPNESKYQVLQGDIYLDQKMTKEALECYRRVLDNDPDNGDALVSMSKYYQVVGDTVAMMSVLDKMMRNKSVDIEPKLAVLKDLITRPSEIPKVETYLTSLLEMYPEEEGLHNYNYLLLMMKQQTAAAENELHIMLELNPQNKVTWMRLIDMKIKQENFAVIDSLCSKALSYFSDDVDFHFYQAIALFQLGQYRKTIDICNRALKLVPDENIVLLSQIYTQLGDTYYKLGMKDSTFTAYTQSLKYQPNNVGTLNNYAYYLSLEKKDLQKAENMSAKTVAAEPSNPTYLDTYAWIFFVRGNYSLARLFEKQAIENGGDKSPEVLEHYGDILFMSGEKEEAVEWWKKAVQAGNDAPLLKKKIEAKSYFEK